MSNPSVLKLQELLFRFEQQPVAFDFETYGLDATHPEGWVRSVGLANDIDCVAIDFRGAPSGVSSFVCDWLSKQRLIAHNYVFDGAWLTKLTGKITTGYCCTYGLLAQLHNEDNTVSWSLKSAMKNILGWPESNEQDLYDWLKENGHKKSEMSLAPFEILGNYNALDAAATWQLYKYLRSVMFQYGWGETLWEYHQKDFMGEISLLIEQQFSGMHIDVDKLREYRKYLTNKVIERSQDILQHPKVAPWIDLYNSIAVKNIEDQEPEEFTKTGKVAARWLKWKEKLEIAKDTQHFNLASTASLSWLLYDRMKFPVLVSSEKGAPAVNKKAVAQMGEIGRLIIKYREVRDELKFVESAIALQVDGVFHPQMKSIGTITGRLGGGVS